MTKTNGPPPHANTEEHKAYMRAYAKERAAWVKENKKREEMGLPPLVWQKGLDYQKKVAENKAKKHAETQLAIEKGEYKPHKVSHRRVNIEMVESRERSDAEILRTDLGENSQISMHSLDIMRMPPINLNDAGDVAIRTEEYVNLCIRSDMKPSVEGLALAYGISRYKLNNIVSNGIGVPRDVVDVMERSVGLINAILVDYLQGGKINPIAGIFLLRNTAGYTNYDANSTRFERKEDDQSTHAAEIAEKYKDIELPE